MLGLTGCQNRDLEKSKYVPHYLSSNNPNSGFESLFIFTAVVIGGMAWAIQTTGVNLESAVTAEPRERVLSPHAFAELSAAAKRGEALAQNNLGVCHYIGQAVVLVASLSPSAIVAGKRRGAELATALSAKQAVKQAKDAVK